MASDTISKLEAHERECAIRYETIEKRMASGSKRFDKLENLIYGIYALIITSMFGVLIERVFFN
jgi:chaperonin cofactor prefoldin